MNTINNLEEFLAWRGFSIKDGPYYWARCFYKYTDCGPWVNFILKDRKLVYYEDQDVNERVTNETCSGIQVGSIVEGSDACFGPESFYFPFEAKAFDEMVENMEADTSFYWKRDNASWYRVWHDKCDSEWIIANVWGDIEWQGGEPPAHVKEAAEKAIENDWQDDPNFKGAIIQTIPQQPHTWAKPQPGWKPMPLVDGYEIYGFEPDWDLY